MKRLLIYLLFYSCSSLDLKELPPLPLRPKILEEEREESLKENVKTLIEYIYDLEDWSSSIKSGK